MAKINYNYTNNAWNFFEYVTDSPRLDQRNGWYFVHRTLKKNFVKISFCDELKRFIHQRVNANCSTQDEFEAVIKDAFKNKGIPHSFEPTTTKLSVFAKACVTKQTVSRETILLLGFAFRMTGDDVNMLLEKGIREQGINPKDPREVICWYCYGLDIDNRYAEFERLYGLYEGLSAAPQKAVERFEAMQQQGENLNSPGDTRRLRMSLSVIGTETELLNYLQLLKFDTAISRFSRTAFGQFKEIYDEIGSLLKEDASGDTTEDQIAMDIERALYDGSYTASSNLREIKHSDLNELMPEKRLSRQRICRILNAQTDVCRTDLITLNFYLFSLYDVPTGLKNKTYIKRRFDEFYVSTNKILQQCYMAELILQNPYENFILECMTTQRPCELFSDVWEHSFEELPPES